MQVTEKPTNVPYRIIIRDEVTQVSKSFGVYTTDFDLLMLHDVLKDYIRRVESGEPIEEDAVADDGEATVINSGTNNGI